MSTPQLKIRMSTLVGRYLRYREQMGYKPSTNLINSLNALADAWDGQRHPKTGRLLERSARSVDALWIGNWFIPHYAHLAANTRRGYASAIARFIEWGAEQREFDPAAALFTRGKVSSKRSKAPVWLTYEQVKSVWLQCPPYWRGLVAITFLTGARGKEIVEMRVGDINWGHGYINARRFKTEEDDYLKLLPEAENELRMHLAELERMAGRKLKRTDYVFPPVINDFGPTGQEETVDPAKRRTRIGDVVKRLIIRYSPEDEFTATQKLGMGGHTLRRSAMRWLFFQFRKAGVPDPLGAVQGQGGWLERATVEQYIGITASRQARDEAFERLAAMNEEQPPPLTLVPGVKAG